MFIESAPYLCIETTTAPAPQELKTLGASNDELLDVNIHVLLMRRSHGELPSGGFRWLMATSENREKRGRREGMIFSLSQTHESPLGDAQK